MNDMDPKPDTSHPLIRVSQLTKSYRMGEREIPVLKGISLELQRGQFVLLRGASGAGKSTLLHLIAGLDQPNTGSIEFDGKAIHQMSGRRLARLRNLNFGLVFQAYHLFPELDAIENVCLPGRIARQSAAKVAERAARLLDRVGLGSRIHHRPAELSGGEQQRVAIARALINEPECLLADEPTGNLDTRTGSEIIDLLEEIQKETGALLLVATHDERMVDRVPETLELVDGEFVQKQNSGS